MIDLSKEIANENLTQKDIMQFLLHSTQHVATREELDSVKQDLKQDISKVETTLKQDISKVETSLKQDISKLEDKMSHLATKDELTKVETSISKLENKLSKISDKFDKILWLIVATTITILLKEKILLFLGI